MDTKNSSHLAGEASARLDPALLEEHPLLGPFEVLTAEPVIAMLDKLDALYWRSVSDDPDQVTSRARDVYDLACLLHHETMKPRLSSQLAANLHEIIVNSIPGGPTARAAQRPSDRPAASPAFEPTHPACHTLRDAYPKLRHLMHSDEHRIELNDALTIIHNSSHLT